MIAFALLLAALAPDDGLTEQIAHCGIARDQVSARYEATLQDESAAIATPAAALTGPMLTCLVGLAESGRIFAFTDPAAQARYDPLMLASERKAAAQEARQWLADQGLLARLPGYDPRHQSLGAFGASLETLCGIAPGTTLKADGAKLIVTLPSDPQTDDAGLRRFQCMFSAMLVIDPDQRMFVLGLTGNEQAKRGGE